MSAFIAPWPKLWAELRAWGASYGGVDWPGEINDHLGGITYGLGIFGFICISGQGEKEECLP